MALQDLLDPAAADDVLGDVLASRPTTTLEPARAFLVVAHAGRTPLDELSRQVSELERRCSADGYERFILNWAMWLHGLALRDPYWAERGIDQQYEYLAATGLAETWLTSYSRAVTAMIDGESGREQLAQALRIAYREGYRIEGDCMLALAYSEACRDEPVIAAELLGLARTCRFNATAHHVLYGLVVDPIVRGALGSSAEHRAALERGQLRSVESTLREPRDPGPRLDVSSGSGPATPEHAVPRAAAAIARFRSAAVVPLDPLHQGQRDPSESRSRPLMTSSFLAEHRDTAGLQMGHGGCDVVDTKRQWVVAAPAMIHRLVGCLAAEGIPTSQAGAVEAYTRLLAGGPPQRRPGSTGSPISSPPTSIASS